jgi:hypothetical protein
MDDDFGRYIIGTNSGRSEYSSRRLGQSRKPTYKNRYAEFVGSLSKRQKTAFLDYELNHRNYAVRSAAKRFASLSSGLESSTGQSLPKIVRPTSRTLRPILGVKKYQCFIKYILPFLNNPTIDQDSDVFDLRIAQRWILKRILDLGWSPKNLGRLDAYIQRSANWGREEHKAERVGKKFQWIAYHQFLASLLDNFEYKGDSFDGSDEKYDGPWQLYVRDIDPSVLITETKSERRKAWWAPIAYKRWDRDESDDKTWIADSADVPDLKGLLIVTNPAEGSRWITLQGWYHWEEPVPPEEERFEKERREIWNLARCYLVRRKNFQQVFRWAKRQNFMGRWMPENHELWRVFLGEFPWAPAFRFQDQPYYSRDGWTRGRDNNIPAPILSTVDEYLGESSSRDCSVHDTIHVTLPSKFIVEGMGLNWNGSEGNFFDSEGQLVAVDPSVRGAGPRALLIRETTGACQRP